MSAKTRKNIIENQINDMINTMPSSTNSDNEPVIIDKNKIQKLKNKYINLQKLFTNKNIQPFNDNWSIDDIEYNLKKEKENILGSSSCVNHLDITDNIVKSTTKGIEHVASNIINLEGFSDRCSSNDSITDTTKILISDVLDMFITKGASNPYYNLIMQICIELAKTCFFNRISSNIKSSLSEIEIKYNQLNKKPDEHASSSVEK
jgi:hypothetical protein